MNNEKLLIELNKLKEKINNLEKKNETLTNYAKSLEHDNSALNEHNNSLKMHIDQLEALITRDKLTGLNNRRIIDDLDFNDLTYACVCDIDKFKQINDGYGHNAGDSVLQSISSILKEKCNNYDVIIRYGGDEFVIFTKDPNYDSFYNRVNDIKNSINNFSKDVTISMSFGIGILSKEEDLNEQIGDIDRAMYSSKSKGGNCITCVDETLKNEKRKK